MITLAGINRNKHYLAPSGIASVTEAGASNHWHGVCAIVRTFDGQVLEVRERANDVARKVKEATS